MNVGQRCLLGAFKRRNVISRLYTILNRNLSTDLVRASVNDKTGVATVKLDRKPVNSLNFDLLTDITIVLDKIENDKSIRGAILTSNTNGVFSAGLDIMEFYTPDKVRLGEFWRLVQEMWIKLYGLTVPVVAAINGHSPAGGCLMAMCCDYRVMAAGKYTIGLNETKLGIVAPWWFVETMVKTVGHRETERALQLGHMYDVDSALKVGLIDQVVDESEVLSTCETEINKWIKIPTVARMITKDYMRKNAIQKLQAGREADVTNFVDYMSKNSVQKLLQEYVSNLKKKELK